MCSGRGKPSFLGVSYQQPVRTQEATCITSPTGALLPTPPLWVSVTHGRTRSCWKQHIFLLWSECLDCGPPHIHKTLTQSFRTFLLIPRSPPGPGSTYYKAPRLRGLLGQPAQQPQPGAFCWVMFKASWLMEKEHREKAKDERCQVVGKAFRTQESKFREPTTSSLRWALPPSCSSVSSLILFSSGFISLLCLTLRI